ncbi:MAG: DUF1939 domain-containing protein [Chlorobi bacterium]|nr:DUF1939 domain-containing protein [Chlorobiota bacterium]
MRKNVFILFYLLTIVFSIELQAQNKILIQGFYWDVLPGGVWYAELENNAAELGAAGFDMIWLPPPSKGAAGASDVGYTPYDYFDLGNYYNKGTVQTLYGSKAELISAVNALHNAGLEVIVDLVLNHRAGGEAEPNIYAQWFDNSFGSLTSDGNGNTFTAFPLATGSKRISWAVGDGNEFFYPNGTVNPDNTFDFYSNTQLNGYHEMYVNSFTYDNALHDGTGANLPMGDSIMVWGDWLTNEVGFDGYRFDFVKGIHPTYLKAFLSYGAMNGKFSVGELYDGNLTYLNDWLNQMSGTTQEAAVFDFNMRFAYKDLSDQGNNYDIRNWHWRGLFNNGANSDRVVNFIDNHDFDRTNWQGVISGSGHSPVTNQKMICYAHMMTHPGNVMVWWRDYFIYGYGHEIDNLISIRKQYASGFHVNLTALTGNDAPYFPGNPSDDPKHVFVMQRNGTNDDNGLILAINKNTTRDIDVWVSSQKWNGEKLYDVTGNCSDTVTVQADGRAMLPLNKDSYSIFVPVPASPPSSIAIDGIFEGETLWGAPVDYADGNAGWQGVNVDKIYVSYDADYAYFAAFFKDGGEPDGSMRAAFAVNSKSGGGSAGPWGSGIVFGYADKPDFVVVGRLGSDWAELRQWSGSDWTTDKSNVYTYHMDWSKDYSYVEARIPKSLLNASTVDLQFYVSGGDDDGNFDSCPDDVVTTGANTSTTLDNYYENAIVPVELTSFSAKAKDGSVLLTWQTASESNNKGFQVERRKAKGKSNWESIAFIEGAGTTSEKNNYSFTDKNIENGKYFYRLKQIDFDGAFSFSDIIEVETVPMKFSLGQNYPNPFGKGTITNNASTKINFSLPASGKVKLEVFNSLGQKISTLIDATKESGNHSVIWNADSFPSGIYFYRFQSGGFVQAKKMLLVR